MYQYKNIKSVHLEVTTKCNANCPMCSRNNFGVVCPKLKLVELTLKDCKKIFPVMFIEQITNINICGAYGDPTMAQELLEIIEYFHHINPNLKVEVYTNGGARSISWWERLAQVTGRQGKVVFGIDGLEDTNYIYRRGIIFSLVLRNATAFIRAGGNAQWDFIVFKHNEHQVEQARKLSVKLGFNIFQIKRTNRFCKMLYKKDPAFEGVGERFGKYPLYNLYGQKYGYIELPENPDYCNYSQKKINSLIKKFGSLNKYFDKTPINCKAKRDLSIFISATGMVYPCCWIYNQANCKTLYNITDKSELGIDNIIHNIGGIHQISAKENLLKDIIEGEFFKGIEESWNLPKVTEGRLKICASACGCHADTYEDQFENKALIPGISHAENPVAYKKRYSLKKYN